MRKKPTRRPHLKAMPRYIFRNDKGSIEIRRNLITIEGAIESAALAFAEVILDSVKAITPNITGDRWGYMETVEVVRTDGVITLNLLDKWAIDSEKWTLLKSHVEKICNNLTAFM